MYIAKLFLFFRATLGHFEGDKNWLIELYNGVPGLLSLIQ